MRASTHLELAPPSLQRVLLVAPLVLVASTYIVFQAALHYFGQVDGYMIGFAFYWVVWGIAVPLFTVGRDGIAAMFRPGRSHFGMPAAIAVPLLAAPAGYGFLFVFPGLFPSATDRLLLAAAVYAIMNGVLEEVFWRGLFARTFANDAVRGVVYPAAGFALWQLVPFSLFPIWFPGDAIALVVVSLGLGLLYGWIAWRTGSIRWTALAHVSMNLSGIGAFLVYAPGPGLP